MRSLLFTFNITTFTYLDSKVIFPVVGKRLVELAILLFRDIIWVTCPDRLCLVQFLVLHETNQQSCLHFALTLTRPAKVKQVEVIF